MIGQTILHYKITDRIGAGGMGEVYLAEDTKLGRRVALKFLPEQVRSDRAARERFLREARAASQLSHPHVVSLFYIEETDTHDFIVMEYVAGSSLREAITAGVPLGKALRYGQQIASALAAAHAKGIVHRDMKAENVVLNEAGDPKILDFGLAQLEGATRITEADSTVGTLAYMSPEQVRGDDVDARSDLFSLGVLLYEMVSGQQPFRGEHRAAVTYAIANEEPEPLARYKADVPDELQRIIDKALRKDLSTRYQSAADLAADLEALRTKVASGASSTVSAPGADRREGPERRRAGRRWVPVLPLTLVAAVVLVVVVFVFVQRTDRGRGTGDDVSDGADAPAPGAGSDRVRVAVIPFDNLGDPDDAYFADGITEEITARLASIPELGVIARTSVLRYKDTDLPIQQIGDELDVQYVLEGTVRWQHSEGGDSRVRVTPQLIRTADETHTWADVYDEPLTEVFTVQSDIARKVIEALNLTLVGDLAGADRPTDNLEAYDLYLRAASWRLTGRLERLPDTQRALEQAIALDPEFADAHASLSVCYSDRYWFVERNNSIKALSKQSADRAMALAPNAFEPLMAMGMYFYHCELNYERALDNLEAALAIKPGDALTMGAIGFVKRRQGEWDGALEYLKRAAVLDPKSPLLFYEVGETLADMRRWDEAVDYLRRSLELDPDGAGAHAWLVYALVQRDGNTTAAKRLMDDSPLGDDPSAVFPFIRYNFISRYDREYSEAIAGVKASDFDVATSHFEYTPKDQMLAELYALVGDTDNAQIHFERARDIIRRYLAENPADHRALSALGEVEAGLGNKEAAIAAARKACELMPVEKEAKQGPRRRRSLATVYAMVGEPDQAIDELEFLLSIHGGMLSLADLRLDPRWDPLRDHPRFDDLLRRAEALQHAVP